MTVAIAVLFGLARVLMVFDPPPALVVSLFKDAAHFFVAYVFTRWWFDRSGTWYGAGLLAVFQCRKSYLLVTGILLSLLEVAAAVTAAFIR
jgi:hypothetical protein